MPPYKGRCQLAQQNPRGYISPGASIHHSQLQLGQGVYIGDGVIIYQDRNGGPVALGEGVHLHDGIIIEVGPGGSVSVGAGTHIQPRCQITAYECNIAIGRAVSIAPYCAFYSYDHGTALGIPLSQQSLRSKGPIIVEDDAWLGVGAIVLSGVRIGKGSVVAAGAVVTRDVPDNAVVAGVPARVVKMRS